jgi:hypothetical protein
MTFPALVGSQGAREMAPAPTWFAVSCAASVTETLHPARWSVSNASTWSATDHHHARLIQRDV